MKQAAQAPQGGAPYYGPIAPPPAAAAPTWRAKAGYVGTGIVIGLVIYPFVRKSLARIQPGLDKLFDGLTGKAEGAVEMAADLLAKAKQNLKDEARATPDDQQSKAKKDAGAPGHDHDHDH